MVSTINLLTCWKYIDDGRFQLHWDNGQVLICAKAKFTGVLEISEMNRKELQLNNAYFPKSDPHKTTQSSDPKNPSKSTTPIGPHIKSGVYRTSLSQDNYYIKSFNEKIGWYSEQKGKAVGGRTVGTGQLEGRKLTLSWSELPPATGSGIITFILNDDNSLTVMNGDRFALGTQFLCVQNLGDTEHRDTTHAHHDSHSDYYHLPSH